MTIFYDAEASFPWFHPQINLMTHQQTFKHTSCSYICRSGSGLYELIDMHDLSQNFSLCSKRFSVNWCYARTYIRFFLFEEHETHIPQRDSANIQFPKTQSYHLQLRLECGTAGQMVNVVTTL